MTNLERWLLYGSLFIVPYALIIWGPLQVSALDKWIYQIKILPIFLIILFGMYAAGTVLLRTFNFNECPEAAEQLQKQIKEAREDLTTKGFKFRDQICRE